MNPQSVPSIVFHLARTLGGGDPAAELAVALACQATQSGHVCADLDMEAGWGPWAAEMDEMQRAAFRAQLPEMKVVGDDEDWTPLVWDGRRLALRRYRAYERQIAQDLYSRAEQATAPDAAMEARLAETFADVDQRQAARIALTHCLCLISGGPGTGKTHTLARIIGLLPAGQRIALAAPTGKAAARMAEALQATGVSVADGAQTIHRLLGMRADGSGFYRGRERPLVVDVLVVDEASMIDLSLMAHLLAALPATARLVLLGDRDQLAAVEAGAVFADLCASESLATCVATLRTSFRFGGASGIGQLAESLRAGDAEGALSVLRAGGGNVDWQHEGSQRALIEAARSGFDDYRAAVETGLPPSELFERFTRFRVLCAHRYEAAAINAALSGSAPGQPQVGLPIMVLRNDPQLRVFNGDIGLVLHDPADAQLKACFPGDDAETMRWVALTRLSAWEPAWAMTVHKSQGSEFARVLLALPTSPSPVVTRELVYTGVTRAKSGVTLWANEAVLRAATERRAERMSALRDLLVLR